MMRNSLKNQGLMQSGVCYLPAFHCKIQIRRVAVKTLLQELIALVLLVVRWMHCSWNLSSATRGRITRGQP